MKKINRLIPATMATQHPDNASAPYWESDGDGYISAYEEVRECYSAFKDLNCQEFMWDWEGKYVDEAVVDRLFQTYFEYFKKNELGKDIFLTFRIPNIWQEKGFSLARSMMAILTAENLARDINFHSPPLFEVILPMVDAAEKIVYIEKTFSKLAKFKCQVFGESCRFNYLNVLPLIEQVDDLLDARKILDRYLHLHKKEYGRLPDYWRLHIARSDPALNSGLVAAVLATKAALSEYYRFGRDHKIQIFPAIGVGTLPFRGGLSPERIDDFIAEYAGVKTVYIQSAFRYDFPLKTVKKAINRLNAVLPKTEIKKIYNQRELGEIRIASRIFQAEYRRTVERLAPTINYLAKEVPSRRERKLHIGLFGYSRGIGKRALPRAIPFTAVLYSLGVPPELISSGRGLREVLAKKIDIEKYYINFRKDIILAGRYLNKENLERLSKKSIYWRQISQDVAFLENYLGQSLGPKENADYIHRNISSNIYFFWQAKKPISQDIISSGKIRKSLG